MTVKKILLFVALLSLIACSGGKQRYQDTSHLETPPRLPIIEKPALPKPVEEAPLANQFVYLDDIETPPVLKIKKLFDRSWDLVDQALEKNKIEVFDKNRDQGLFFVKYDPTRDTGKVFGNINILFFDQGFDEAEYQISVVWHETATEVRAKITTEEEFSVDDEDEVEIGDASAQLIQVLYEAINEQLKEPL